jgi:hypothetical protein
MRQSLDSLLERVATGLSTAADAVRLHTLLCNGGPMNHSSTDVSPPEPALEPLVTILCKEVIIAVHSGGAKGLAIDEALRSFGRRGISRLQSDLFIESMTRAGLVAGGSEGRLHATVRGLAYAGINPRGAVAGSRVAAP